METFKESYLRILAEKQERGLICRLTGEEQKRLEVRIDARVKKYGRILNDARLSDLDSLRKFGAFLQFADRSRYKTAGLDLKRYWRRKRLAEEKRRKRRQKRYR